MAFREEIIGNQRLICGDCLEVLPTFEAGSVDAVVTDPPYALNKDYDCYKDTPEALQRIIDEALPHMLRVATRTIITCGLMNIQRYPQPTWILSWHSANSNASGPWGFSCWQPILAYGKDPFLQHGKGRRPDTFDYSSLRKNDAEGHPCPKPTDLMCRILERVTFVGEIMLDPFMGSGTTLVAAELLGRSGIGIEISPEYFDIACRRVEDAAKQPKLIFDEPTARPQTLSMAL